MAKQKKAYTKIKGFYNSANQLVDFMKEEIPSDIQKKYDKLLEETQKINWNDENSKKLKEKEKDIKGRLGKLRFEEYEQYQSYVDYAKHLQKYFADEKKGITEDELDEIMRKNINLRRYNTLFQTGKPEEWKHGEAGRNAMDKFMKMVLKNDYKKMQYMKTLYKGELKKEFNLNEIHELTLPVNASLTQNRQLDKEMYEDLKENVKMLKERLEKSDMNRHINSSEFKKMKTALNELEEELGTRYGDHTYTFVGLALENLQEASMNYIRAKGVGRQSTKLGKERMDIALDICSMSSDYMDYYASAMRSREIKEFEEQAVVNPVSHVGVNPNFRQVKPTDSYLKSLKDNEEQLRAEWGNTAYEYEVEDIEEYIEGEYENFEL